MCIIFPSHKQRIHNEELVSSESHESNNKAITYYFGLGGMLQHTSQLDPNNLIKTVQNMKLKFNENNNGVFCSNKILRLSLINNNIVQKVDRTTSCFD